MARDTYTADNANVNSTHARLWQRPQALVCDCGKPATYRLYDARANATVNVCQSCKGAK